MSVIQPKRKTIGMTEFSKIVCQNDGQNKTVFCVVEYLGTLSIKLADEEFFVEVDA